jgi:Tfp pilus assembly protein PilN
MARWNSCNILHVAADANRLWQFDAKGGGFVLNREHTGAPGQPLPPKFVQKSWDSLWQPKLNVAWLPPENVFLRVVELPKSSIEETLSMVEFQLEKLSPIPLAQIVWTFQVLPQTAAENLQTVIVVLAERSAVEEFLGKLEAQGYLADRLEAPMLDQLQSAPANEDGAWIYPVSSGGQSIALAAWWIGGALRSLSFIVLPSTGDRVKSLKDQLAQLTWAGEIEGWLTAQPKWHLVADSAMAGEWETFLREGLGEPVQVISPLPSGELAARTAQRVTGANPSSVLLPAEFSKRYQEQFFDRLWLHGLGAALVLYLAVVAVYFCATGWLALKTNKIEQQVADVSGSYTNALLLKARYDVLEQRQELKFAALDCWKLVAEQLPAGVSLQRLSFSNGRRLSLNGTVPSEDINKIIDFNETLRKSQLNGQPMFNRDPGSGEPLVYRQGGDQVTWNFALDLQNAEEAP